MRLLSLLTVSLLAATASADPPPLPFEVIRVLPSTKQVLVYDRALDTHVLLAPGSKVGDYVVVEISGVGLSLESKHERLTVYPRAAKGLVMELEPHKNSPPVIYSKTGPAAAPAHVAAAPAPQVAAPQVAAPHVAAPQVAAPHVAAPQVAAPQVAAPQATRNAAEPKMRTATDLASLLTVDANPRRRGASLVQAAKPKR